MKPRYTNRDVLLNHFSNKHQIVHFIQNKQEDRSPPFFITHKNYYLKMLFPGK